MTRLVRLLLPLSLSALSTGAVVMACHHGDAPVAPRPELTDPSGKPITTIGPGLESPGDAGVDALLGAPPAGAAGQPLSAVVRGTRVGGREATVLLASQPMTPPASGAPAQPGAPSPSQPSPAQPSPAQPSPGAPGSPPTGSPQPGAPPPSPASPSPGSPRPGSGSGSSSPAPSTGPTDAGVSDAGLPRLPPIVDAGFPDDSGMQPILRRK